MITITLQSLKNQNGVCEAIEYFKDMRPSMLVMPKKPFLKKNPSSREAMQYAEDLKVYEAAKKEWVDKEKERMEAISKMEDVLREYLEDMAGVDKVPKKSRDKVWNFAWREGHSAGYYEVYNYLCDLVDLF